MEADSARCSQCGMAASADTLARFGNDLVCPQCKDAYAQRLREGVAAPSARVGAGFWIRFGAVLIDGAIMWIVQMVIIFAAGGAGAASVASGGDTASIGIAGAIAYFLIIAVAASYEAVLVHMNGATFGKMALGLQVLRPDGSRLSLGRAYGRYFAKMVSAIIFGIGYIMAAFDAQKRALHDRICDTRVTKTR